MKTVEQALKGKAGTVLSVQPDASVLDALKTMALKDVGALVVLDAEGALAGIFSERDYARKVILFGKASKDTKVREVMTERVVCVRPDNTIDDCMSLMTDKRIRHLPVLDQGRVVGVISIGDAVKEKIAEQQFMIQQLEQYIAS